MAIYNLPFIAAKDGKIEPKVDQNWGKDSQNELELHYTEKSGQSGFKFVPNGLKRSWYRSKQIKTGSNLTKMGKKLDKMSQNRTK